MSKLTLKSGLFTSPILPIHPSPSPPLIAHCSLLRSLLFPFFSSQLHISYLPYPNSSFAAPLHTLSIHNNDSGTSTNSKRSLSRKTSLRQRSSTVPISWHTISHRTLFTVDNCIENHLRQLRTVDSYTDCSPDYCTETASAADQ